MKKSQDEITRKEAIKKMGKYATFAALGTFLILKPKLAQAASAPDPSGPFKNYRKSSKRSNRKKG